MEKENLIKVLFRNTLASYLATVLGLVAAIWISRMLYLGLPREFYGFWALLWTVFGYSLLLDFGFGTSVQKYTAEMRETKDYDTFNKLLSTVIASYCLMSVIIICVTLFLASFLSSVFTIEPISELRYYQMVFAVFGIGVAFIFPTGVFAEVLVGMNRSDLENYVRIFSTSINISGIYLIFKFDHSLMTLAIFSLSLNLSTNILLAYLAYRLIPKLKISYKYFQIEHLKEVVSFSLFAYLITCAYLICNQTDQIVLGVMAGMVPVATYQIGSKIPQMLKLFTDQFQNNLGPIAASLYKSNQMERLRLVLLNSNRIAAFIATCGFVTFFILAKQILFVWLKVTDSLSLHVAYILLISVYIMILFRSVSAKLLLMVGKHKVLALIASIEALVNLLLSIFLISRLGIIGVAYGTLIPNVIVSFFVIFPMARRFSQTNFLYYLKKVYIPVFLLSLPTVALLLFGVHYCSDLEQWNVLMLMILKKTCKKSRKPSASRFFTY